MTSCALPACSPAFQPHIRPCRHAKAGTHLDKRAKRLDLHDAAAAVDTPNLRRLSPRAAAAAAAVAAAAAPLLLLARRGGRHAVGLQHRLAGKLDFAAILRAGDGGKREVVWHISWIRQSAGAISA